MAAKSPEALARVRERDRARPPRRRLTPRAPRPYVYRERPDRPKRPYVYRKRPPRPPPLFIGIDGEGVDVKRPGGRVDHIYTYLAAVDEHGKLWAEAYDPEGLSHEACCEVFDALPDRAIKFGFMFSYDTTKIVQELPFADRYLLMRPETRRRRRCMACRKPWDRKNATCDECGSDKAIDATEPITHAGRAFDFFAGSFTVGARVPKGTRLKGAGGKTKRRKRCKVWDVFKFFQCSFVQALRDWKISTDPEERWFTLPGSDSETTEEIETIARMKDKRGALDKEDPEDVKRYCRSECALLAKMMRKLVEAHERAGIELKRFEGAGSTAGALLKSKGVAAYKGPKLADMPDALQHAILSAFFGGRFENSAIGIVPGPIEGGDISSAYPYALTPLACLACGRWRKVTGSAKRIKKALEESDFCVASFRVRPVVPGLRSKLRKRVQRRIAWGPLPCRDEKGSICYGTNFSGWAWAEELLPALRFAPELVELTGEAWYYTTKCDHKPFEFVPQIYRQRIGLGKDAAGKVIKLGMNALYGRTAQSIGANPPYQSWVWAGVVTATTRGQQLDAIRTAKDRWNVLSIATDGIYSREPLKYAKPSNTGTGDLPKPLGGWETKTIEEGAFLVKPGLYYRLVPKLSDIRARGVGRKEIFKEYKTLISAWRKWNRQISPNGKETLKVTVTSRRFYGAKTSIFSWSGCAHCKQGAVAGIPRPCPTCGKMMTRWDVVPMTLGDGEREQVAYGNWGERETAIAFDPMPKRERVLNKGGTFSRLYVRDLGGAVSKPYDGKTTPEGEAARVAADEDLEQPDAEDAA